MKFVPWNGLTVDNRPNITILWNDYINQLVLFHRIPHTSNLLYRRDHAVTNTVCNLNAKPRELRHLQGT